MVIETRKESLRFKKFNLIRTTALFTHNFVRSFHSFNSTFYNNKLFLKFSKLELFKIFFFFF